MCAHIACGVQSTRYGIIKALHPLLIDYTATRHTHTHRLPIIACNNNKRDEKNRVRFGFLCTDFIYATISIFDTNKRRKKENTKRKTEFWFLLHIDMWLIATQTFLDILSAQSVWFIYEFMICIFFPFPSSSSIQYVSIFHFDWIIIMDVAYLCMQHTRSGECMSMSGLSRKLASICIWLYYDVAIRFVSYMDDDGLVVASGWMHVCPLYVTDLINE